jgi:elongation factor 1-beta
MWSRRPIKVLKMTTAAIKFKIMPENLDVDLKKLKSKIEKTIKSFNSGVFNEAMEEPIAFGLKALVVTFALPEKEEVDKVENAIRELDGVSSVEMIDYRRAVG